MAPAAYAKALNSTSNAYNSTSESNDLHVDKQSAYAFSPSWLNNTTGSSSMKSLNSRGYQSSGTALHFFFELFDIPFIIPIF
jgi:hypothetical protein